MNKKSTKPPIQVVRSMEAVSKEYGETCAKSGEAAFKMKALEAEILQCNKRLVELTTEFKEASIHAQKKGAPPPPEQPSQEEMA